jgi:diguanylate cyclase (GGDEF)-like protein
MSFNPPKGTSAKFFSLRWSIIILLSLILLLVNSALTYLNYSQSTLQYATELENVRAIQTQQIKALLTDGYSALSRISTFIPLIGTSQSGVSTESSLRNMLEQSGTLLDIEWDIQSLYLFSKQEKMVLSWPDIPGLDLKYPPNMVLKKTQISEALICAPGCLQYVASPILDKGETTGHLLIGRSIATPILTFNNLTKSEVVILSSQTSELTTENSSLRHLSYWDKYISAITHPEKTYLIIKQVESQISLGEVAQKPHQLKVNNEWFEVHRADFGAEGLDFLIINNIANNRRQITEAAINNILIGILGLILSEVLLIFLLRSPVTRLVNLTANLPLLVEGKYQLLRNKLHQDRKPKKFINEIDITLDATMELADRLETLQIAREEAELNLTWLADHDTLTDLINRRRFQADFEGILKQAKRYHHQGALLFMDLDAFKEINDLSGHLAGDSLLRQVADTMRHFIRETDLLARLGGDEFAIVMTEATEIQAIELAEKICKVVSKLNVFTEVFTHAVSVSIGIALFPDHGKNVPELMANADMAMYQSKKIHPGRSHIFSIDEKAREKLNQRLIVKDLIIEALDQHLFVFQYQPIIDVKTQRIKYYEALIRIRKRDSQLLYPDSFIPLAEQTGMIQKIDQWVIDQAITVLQQYSDIALSINLSSHVLADEAVVDSLAEQIAQSGIEPSRLLLEVTESGVIHNINTAVNIMQKIRSIGCKFALDDFGTGFASYNHLKLLPVDIIKIDGCFIKNIETSPEDRMFVKSITEIGGSMNMQIVAEYVENGEILEILSELGVQYAQGYHIGKPAALNAKIDVDL